MKEDYYESYWKKTGWRPDDASFREEESHLIEKYFKREGSIVDYGCGSGLRYGEVLNARGNRYVGADVSEAALSQAKSRGIEVQTIDMEDGATSLEGASFDYAMCMEVLEHVMNPTISVQEVHRLLKPKGTFLLSVPNAGVFSNRIEFFLTGFLNPGGSPETSRKKPWEDCHIRFYNVSMIKRLLESNGFEVCEVYGERFSPGDVPYVYRKPRLKRFANGLGFPLWWMGRVFPNTWSGTLYFVARKLEEKAI